MKIIFLDIDGVLNSVQQSVAMREEGRSYDASNLNLVGIGLLKWVCKMTGAEIVVSSTWRTMGLKWLEGVFEGRGWRVPPIVDITPNLSGFRGKEIEHYLAKIEKTKHVESYVIIDDDSDFYDYQKEHFFVHIDSLVGLTIYDAVKMIDILTPLGDNIKEFEGVKAHTEFKEKKRMQKIEEIDS